MKLLRHNGTAFVEVDVTGLFQGMEAIVVGPYGGLPACPIDWGDRIVVEVGNAFDAAANRDLWVGMQTPSAYPRTLLRSPRMKIFGEQWRNMVLHGKLLRSYPNTYFFGDDRREQVHEALRLVASLGITKAWVTGIAGHPERWYDQSLFAFDMEAIGGEYVCGGGQMVVRHLCGCSPRCEGQVFGAPVETLLPLVGGIQMYHLPNLVEECKSPPMPRCQHFGVVTLVDHYQEDILDWWYENLRRHEPHIPVCICDVGMTMGVREKWITRAQNDDPILFVMSVPGECPTAWFKKPLAIGLCPFDTCLHLDPDCEVRDGLDWLHDFVAAHSGVELACAEDIVGICEPENRILGLAAGPMINSGVIYAKTDSVLVDEWAELVQPMTGRGDQTEMNAIFTRHVGDKRLALLPKRGNVMVSPDVETFTPPDDAAIVHHICPNGKARIRRAMALRAAVKGDLQ